MRALAKNKLRAGLTILGVVIGIAAVTAMVSIGTSASELVQGEFTNLGTNVIVLQQGNRRGGRAAQIPSITAADVQAVGRECPSVLAATPIVGASGQIINGNNINIISFNQFFKNSSSYSSESIYGNSYHKFFIN